MCFPEGDGYTYGVGLLARWDEHNQRVVDRLMADPDAGVHPARGRRALFAMTAVLLSMFAFELGWMAWAVAVAVVLLLGRHFRPPAPGPSRRRPPPGPT